MMSNDEQSLNAWRDEQTPVFRKLIAFDTITATRRRKTRLFTLDAAFARRSRKYIHLPSSYINADVTMEDDARQICQDAPL